nr:hypothetical protein [Tanacetum cinerariifolium]
RFKIDTRKSVLDLEAFREMLHISPRILSQQFADLPTEEEVLDFLRFLGHSQDIRYLTDVEHKSQKRSNEMNYLRFTKVIIDYFMTRKPSISRRNRIHWHYVRDDALFSTIKVVSRHQATQKYGAILPIELTTNEIRNSKAYQEYYACAMGEAAPKPKASARKKKGDSASSTTLPTPTPTTTAESAPRLSASAKGKRPLRATTPSRQETHISQQSGSGTGEATGSKPGVPDVPSDDSEEELSSDKDSEETVKSRAGKDGDDDDDEDNDDDDEEEETAKNDEELKKTGIGGDEVRKSGGESENEKETSEEEEVYVIIVDQTSLPIIVLLVWIMATTIEQQTVLDESLVPSSQRLRIGRSNFRLPSDIQSKEATLQVVYDVLRNSPLFRAFQVTVDVPEIYMQEFWAIAKLHHNSIRFKIDTRKSVLDLEAFREMLHISPRIPNQPFADLPTKEEVLDFLRFLGHNNDIRYLTDVKELVLNQGFRMYHLMIQRKNFRGDEVRESEGESESEEEEGSFDPIPRTPEDSE